MPRSEQEDKGQKAKEQERDAKLRQNLSKGYAAVLGEQATTSFSAMTMEEAFDAHIEEIEGAGTDLRPNLLDRVDRVENQVVETANQIKEIQPEKFKKPEEDKDVNTENSETVVADADDAKQRHIDRLKNLFNSTKNLGIKRSIMNQLRREGVTVKSINSKV